MVMIRNSDIAHAYDCTLTTLTDAPLREVAVRVEIDSRGDIGGFTDIDHAMPGAVFCLPIQINNSPIVVTASVCESHSEQLTVWMNGKLAEGLMEKIVRSCALWSGVRGSATIDISCSIKPGSGLGVSSQITAGVVAALARCMGMRHSREELALQAYLIENPLTSCGWQDQATLVIGRCGFITASSALSPASVVPTYRSLPVSGEVLRELERRALLVWTGRSHFSKEILDDVKRRLSRGEARALQARDALFGLACQARDILLEGGPAKPLVSHLAAILIANWSAELKLTDGAVTTEELATVEPMLLQLGGYKLLGAGRGGFLFFIGDSEQASAIAAKSLGDIAGWEVTPWRIARQPARITAL
jgi:galactokinase/mevalonate kinase-like predicted kinase